MQAYASLNDAFYGEHEYVPSSLDGENEPNIEAL